MSQRSAKGKVLKFFSMYFTSFFAFGFLAFFVLSKRNIVSWGLSSTEPPPSGKVTKGSIANISPVLIFDRDICETLGILVPA